MRTNEPFGKALYELFSSMRFAITLLTLLAIASIIGTVLKQAEPYNNYIIQFGPFWFDFFRALGLYDVYHAAWFLIILTFLVASTSLCIYRNAPGMVKEMKSFREHVTEQSLAAFSHKHSVHHDLLPQGLADKTSVYLIGQGFKVKSNVREDGVLISAKRGAASRLGYLFAHGAIVLICIGGLLDGNLVFKAQQVMGTKKIETRDIPQSQVPTISRLSPDNPSFRGSVQVPEGGTADVVFLNIADGYLVQDLPFTVQLKDFRIEHYSTGQPKLFESDIVLFDRKGKKVREATIAVNKPLIHDGVAIYQASFGDGGTKLNLRGWNLFAPSAQPFQVQGEIHGSTKIASNAPGNQASEYQLEFTDFRLFNIENLGGETPKQNAMSVKSDSKSLHNVGPSYQVKVRNARGEAREFHNYMLPVTLDGRMYLLSGVRESPSEPFRYLRIPADSESKIDGFMRLRAALQDPAVISTAAARFAAGALSQGAPNGELTARLEGSARNILGLFSQGGYSAMGRHIETSIPEAERKKATETFLRILELSVFEVLKISNAQAGQPAPVADDATGYFIRDSLNAFSDLFFYGAPVYLQLESFEQVQASGLQMTRSPGQNLVYFGSLLLVLGIFAMLYVRERRAWVLVKPGSALFAYSTPRKTVDFEQEFAKHSADIETLAASATKE